MPDERPPDAAAAPATPAAPTTPAVHGSVGRLATSVASAIGRHPWRMLAACVILTLAALVPASRLRIDSDLSALLPNGAPAADDYRVFLRTFGGFEKVFVLVRAPGRRLEDPGPLEEAAAALADEMRRSPEVAEARSGRTEDDERFFYRYIAPRMPLLMGDARGTPFGRGDALAARLAPAAIHQRVAFMRQTLATPAGAALAPLFASDPLGLSEGLLGAMSAALPMDPLTGAFVSRRGDAALVILTPARPEIDPAGGRALLAALDKAYARVRSAARLPLDFKAIGGPIYAAQDEGILRGDLSRTVSSTLGGVALVLLVGFEGFLLPMAILVAVLAGLVWTAGLVGMVSPTVTVVGVGFAAALVGMGVDYGIHGGVQYRHLRLAGGSVPAALAGAFRDTGPGVLTAALSTAAGLAALLAAHFRPLREVGMALALGVLATLLATMTLSAALVAGAGGRRPPAPPRLWTRWGLPAVRGLVRLAQGWAPWVVGGALALSALAAWGLSRSSLSTDLRALRPANAPSAEAERLLFESFSLGLDTFSVVARGGNLDQALDRAAAVSQLLRRRLGPEAEITAPSDLLVQGDRRVQRLAELRRLPLAQAADDLDRELAAAGFRPQPFAPAVAVLRALGRGEDPMAPPAAAWPSWMRELVRTGPGVYGVVPGGAAVAVHVRMPLARGGALPVGLATELARISPDIALASVTRVGAELKELAAADLLRSSLVALVLVGTVVLVIFRGRVGQALMAFLPLALGSLWTFGLWAALGHPLDLLGVFTVPLLLGTGINLGGHAMHWRRLHPGRGMAGTIEDVGLAMIMATFTTAVGFGSLISSRVPGLAHDGVLVSVGITTCLLVTFVVLPALEELRSRQLRRGAAS